MDDHRPAIIGAALDDIDLVAAAGPQFGFPQQPGRGIEGQTFRAAQPEAQISGIAPAWPAKGLPGTGAPSGVMWMTLPRSTVQLLRRHPVDGLLGRGVPVADGHEQIAVAPEGDAPAGLAAQPLGRPLREAAENDFHVAELVPVKPRPPDIGVGVVLRWFAHEIGKGEEDAVIAAETGIDRDIQQHDLLAGGHGS